MKTGIINVNELNNELALWTGRSSYLNQDHFSSFIDFCWVTKYITCIYIRVSDLSRFPRDLLWSFTIFSWE